MLSPTGSRLSPTTSLHQLEAGKDRFVLRVITNHCFLECTDHVVRLAQRPKDVDRMYDGMLTHLQDNYARALRRVSRWATSGLRTSSTTGDHQTPTHRTPSSAFGVGSSPEWSAP